jgi:hypothetical protein
VESEMTRTDARERRRRRESDGVTAKSETSMFSHSPRDYFFREETDGRFLLSLDSPVRARRLVSRRPARHEDARGRRANDKPAGVPLGGPSGAAFSRSHGRFRPVKTLLTTIGPSDAMRRRSPRPSTTRS